MKWCVESLCMCVNLTFSLQFAVSTVNIVNRLTLYRRQAQRKKRSRSSGKKRNSGGRDVRLRKSEERERDWRGGERRQAGAGLTVIALCRKQQGTSKPWPAPLLSLCPSPSHPPYQPSVLPSSTQTLKTLSQIPIYSIRAEIYTGQWVSLSFPDTHTHRLRSLQRRGLR